MSQRRFFYGWVVVAAAAVIVAVGVGALFSLAVYLQPMQETMGWSRAAISSIALLNWIAMGLGSFVWGMLSDRIGSRRVAAAGGVVLGFGLVLSSLVTALWQLALTFGVLVGFAVGAFYAPLTSTATRWFTARRGLAVALVSAGIGIGVFTISPLTGALTSAFGWRTAMLLMGDLAWLVIVPAALLVRNAPGDVGAVAMGGGPARERDFSTAQVLASRPFWAIAVTHFACCAAHSGPIFHMVTHATDQGIAKMAAATVLGVSGLSSIAGRIGCGLLADRFGAKQTLVAGLALQAAMIFLYLFARDLGTFYALAFVFGVAYGGVMPIYAIVTREYFGERIMGTAYGAVFLISTLGMGLGSFAGGWLYDRLGSYAWLYVGSFGIGAAAALLALTFRRPALTPRAARWAAAP